MTKEQILQKHFTAEFGHDDHGEFMQYILDAMEEYAQQQVKNLNIPVVIHSCDDLKKRTDECSECDMMANYEDPDKWDGVKKCPKCGKDTEILKQAWD